ncbi:MAG TPA: TetR/AcrR family transcriptional regulator [Solirubrobacterales bacterium]|nr:TetR/AcrR family transcriptional regulator [Solirubrobacterales bacterium]
MTETATPAVADEGKTTSPAAPAKPPTRDRILFATAELFRRQGYHGTGLKQIVAEADAPFGSLYHHFPGGKGELGEQVIDSAGAFFQALVTGVYDSKRSPEDAVRAVFVGAAATLEATDYEDACPIATVALEVASTDDRLRAATAAVFERWTEALTERLGDRGKALAVIAALEGAFVLCRASRGTEAMHAAGEMAAALVA